MMRLSWSRGLGAIASLIALTAAACSVGDDPEPRPAMEPEGRPNVLIVLTDDQRADGTLEVMPSLRRLYGERGTTFVNAYATTPLCCPSRASIFSGRYAHNHEVLKNTQPELLDQSSTMQRYLSEAGYRTGFVGKYFNAWDLSVDPAHFDRWSITKAGYYGAEYNVDGELRSIGKYATHYMRDTAFEYLEQFETQGDEDPWLLFVSTTAVHKPEKPEPKYADADIPRWEPNPAVTEEDVSDKPPIPDRGLSPEEGAALRERQLRTLMTVDDVVAELDAKLEEMDEGNTLAIFVSDNGHSWGEHHFTGKRLPYVESVKIPLLMRWPARVEEGVEDDRLVANVDLLPTVLDALDLEPDLEYPLDGRSLIEGSRRNELLLEQWGNYNKGLPDWASLVTPEGQYVEYYRREGRVSFREYYDLLEDPWQLENLIGDGRPGDVPSLDKLSDRLRRYRRCAGPRCP